MVKRMRSFFAVVMLVIAAAVNAQVTTSSMSGKVVDQSNEAIIGATIQAIHEPSGTHYGAITNVDGRLFHPGHACRRPLQSRSLLM